MPSALTSDAVRASKSASCVRPAFKPISIKLVINSKTTIRFMCFVPQLGAILAPLLESLGGFRLSSGAGSRIPARSMAPPP